MFHCQGGNEFGYMRAAVKLTHGIYKFWNVRFFYPQQRKSHSFPTHFYNFNIRSSDKIDKTDFLGILTRPYLEQVLLTGSWRLDAITQGYLRILGFFSKDSKDKFIWASETVNSHTIKRISENCYVKYRKRVSPWQIVFLLNCTCCKGTPPR